MQIVPNQLANFMYTFNIFTEDFNTVLDQHVLHQEFVST